MSLIASTLAQIQGRGRARVTVSVRGAVGSLVAAIDDDEGELGAIRECFYRILAADAALVSTVDKPNARARGLKRECDEAFSRLNKRYPNALPKLINGLTHRPKTIGLQVLQAQKLAEALERIQAGENPARALGLIGGRGKPAQAGSTRGFNAAVRCEYLIREGWREKDAARDAAARFSIGVRQVEQARAKERALLATLSDDDLQEWDESSPV